MLEAGIDPATQQICFGQYTESSGYEMTGRLLAAPRKPTAIFAGNNFLAFGAIQALRESGLKIPDDMSIVVFDDLPQGWIIPFLTVIAQPAYQIGKKAAELMLERLGSDEPIAPRTFVLRSSLIVRQSSAPPRSASAKPARAAAKPMENPA
jgi:DNA-binding LacI/PurR family transcriptional regulator